MLSNLSRVTQLVWIRNRTQDLQAQSSKFPPHPFWPSLLPLLSPYWFLRLLSHDRGQASFLPAPGTQQSAAGLCCVTDV